MTSAAVSRSIKSLEDHLGILLFHRQHQKVILTKEGKEYFQDLAEVFDQIVLATDKIANTDRYEKISVSAFPSVLLNWIIPLWCSETTKDLCNNINFEIMMSEDIVLVEREFDAAVMSSEISLNSFRSELLFTGTLVPVCSPKILSQRLPIPIQELGTRLPLLGSYTRPSDWEDWLRANHLQRRSVSPSHFFQSSQLMYEAALSGFGVAPAVIELLEDELVNGRLCIPFTDFDPIYRKFYLVYPSNRQSNRAFLRFRDLLVRGANKQRGAADRIKRAMEGSSRNLSNGTSFEGKQDV